MRRQSSAQCRGARVRGCQPLPQRMAQRRGRRGGDHGDPRVASLGPGYTPRVRPGVARRRGPDLDLVRASRASPVIPDRAAQLALTNSWDDPGTVRAGTGGGHHVDVPSRGGDRDSPRAVPPSRPSCRHGSPRRSGRDRTRSARHESGPHTSSQGVPRARLPTVTRVSPAQSCHRLSRVAARGGRTSRDPSDPSPQ